jgi:hypothetical protein
MYNRYVDGLATWAPKDAEFYQQRGAKVATEGYIAVNQELQAKQLATVR